MPAGRRHLDPEKDYFFAHGHSGKPPDGLPDSPCDHKHFIHKDAATCGRQRGSTHVRKVRNGKAVKDYRIAGGRS